MPFCNGCRIRKEMPEAAAVCGPFIWRMNFCPSCSEAQWKSRWQKLGYKLTAWLSDGEMLLVTPAGGIGNVAEHDS